MRGAAFDLYRERELRMHACVQRGEAEEKNLGGEPGYEKTEVWQCKS